MEAAQAETGEGITETVRAGLRKIAAARSQREFRKLKGTYKFKLNLDGLRDDRK